MIDGLVFMAVPFYAFVSLLEFLFPEVIPDKIVCKNIRLRLLKLQEIPIGSLPAVDPGLVVLKMIIVAVIDVFDRSEKAGAGDAAFPQATLNRLKGKVDVLNAAMHVGVDNLHLKLFFKGLGACFCLVRISAG
jgi:hypothetical protein